MNFDQTMAELKKLGTAQNVKVYKRHGASDNMFGVSFANLYKLQKKIKVDHELALKLWDSGNMDARVLACLVADPAKMTPALADSWAQDVGYYMVNFYLSMLTARTSFAESIMKKWMKAKDEQIRSAGYNILGNLFRDGKTVGDSECKAILKTIEKEIHASPNRARYSMNNAVIAIGCAKAELRKEAIEVGKRIGKVEVDHGDTSCKTPFAPEYIMKAAKRVDAKNAKAKLKKADKAVAKKTLAKKVSAK